LKTSLSYAKLKLNRRASWVLDDSSSLFFFFFFSLASAGLAAPIVVLASTSFAKQSGLLAARCVVLVRALRGIQSPAGERTEISLL
jgi:hypothetical protein